MGPVYPITISTTSSLGTDGGGVPKDGRKTDKEFLDPGRLGTTRLDILLLTEGETPRLFPDRDRTLGWWFEDSPRSLQTPRQGLFRLYFTRSPSTVGSGPPTRVNGTVRRLKDRLTSITEGRGPGGREETYLRTRFWSSHPQRYLLLLCHRFPTVRRYHYPRPVPRHQNRPEVVTSCETGVGSSMSRTQSLTVTLSLVSEYRR